MKILKTAEQKNFTLDTSYYTEAELYELLECGLIADFTKEHGLEYDRNDKYRVYACNCTDIKVRYNNSFGCYETVVLTGDRQLVVIL